MTPLRFLPLVLRQMRRSPRRSLLTFLGLAVSFFLFTSLESLLYTMDQVIERTGSDVTLFVRPRYGVPFYRAEIPRSYVPRIRRVKGVKEATPYLFFIGQGRKEGELSLALGAEAETIRQVRIMQGVSDEEFARFKTERTAAIVGEKLMEQSGWRLGDQVSIREVGGGTPRTLTFRIRGTADGGGNFGRVAMVHLDYLADVTGEKGKLTFVVLRVTDPALAAPVAGAIDGLFANFTVPTETLTEKSFLTTVIGGLSDALRALTVIGYLTLAATIFVVANTVAMSIRERTVEIGTLRTLGYSARLILALVLGEAVTLAAAGSVFGSGTAYAVFEWRLISLPPELGFDIGTDWTLLARACLLSFPVGVLAGLGPAWRAARLPITDALRHAD